MKKNKAVGPLAAVWVCVAALIVFGVMRFTGDKRNAPPAAQERQETVPLSKTSIPPPNGGQAVGSAAPALQGKPIAKSDMMRQAHAQHVDSAFMPAVAAFRLNAEQTAKLRELLIERDFAAADTIAIAQSGPVGAVRVPVAIKQTLADINQEIANLVGPEHAQQAEAMLAAQADFGRIANNYAPSLEKSGYALSPDQYLALGVVLHETYSTDVNPAAKARETLPIDDTGLTSLDRSALGRLSPVLTPPQLQHMQRSFVETNKVRIALQKK